MRSCSFPVGLPGGVWWVLAGLLLAGPTAAELPPRLELFHHDALAGTWQLRQVRYVLDGRLLHESGPRPPGEDGDRLFGGPLSPGLHSLAVRIVYEGRSDVFSYLQRYRLVMRGRMTVDVRPGYVLEVRTLAEGKLDPTLRWEDREAFHLEGIPRKAVVDLEVEPIEKQALPEDGGELPLEPSVTTPPEREQELEAKVEAEVKRELEKAERKPDSEPAPPRAACAAPPIYFRYAKFTLDRESSRVLVGLAGCLAKTPSARLEIQGHCDMRGSAAFNRELGRWRAESAVRFLVQHGAAPLQLEAVSLGKDRPVCQESTLRCHAKNRRVEFTPAEARPARVPPPPG